MLQVKLILKELERASFVYKTSTVFTRVSLKTTNLTVTEEEFTLTEKATLVTGKKVSGKVQKSLNLDLCTTVRVQV